MTSVLPEPEQPDTCRYLASLSAIIQQQQSRMTFENLWQICDMKPQVNAFSPMKQEQHKEEKNREDYAFWRQFNEKPSIIPGCPGAQRTIYGSDSDCSCFPHIDSKELMHVIVITPKRQSLQSQSSSVHILDGLHATFHVSCHVNMSSAHHLQHMLGALLMPC